MKTRMLFASLAILSISTSAMALAEGVPRAVVVGGAPAGLASFYFNGNLGGPFGGCSYYMDWEGPLRAAGSVGCYLTEVKALGQTACLGVRLFDVPTTLKSERGGCEGFDEYGLIEEVSITLSESALGAPIAGVAVYAQFPFIPRSIVLL